MTKFEPMKCGPWSKRHPLLTSVFRQFPGSLWKAKVSQSCLTLCDPINSTVHGILQVRILEWVALPFPRGSSQSRDQTQVSCIAGRFFISWAMYLKDQLKMKYTDRAPYICVLCLSVFSHFVSSMLVIEEVKRNVHKQLFFWYLKCMKKAQT